MWGVIPVTVRRNKLLSDKAKLLYAEISDYTDDNGVCNKQNSDFAEYLDVAESTARRYLYELRDMQLICIDGDGKDRRITFPEKMVLVEGATPKKREVPLRSDLSEKIVSIWNEKVAKKGIRVTPKLTQTITSRAKNFSDEEIIKAVENRCHLVNNSDWHLDPKNSHHRNNIYIVLRSDQDLERHLYMEDRNKQSNNGNSIKVLRF